MKQQLVSLAVLAVCLASAVAQDKYVEKTKPCGPQVFAKLDTCCTMPKLLPFETFKTCFGGSAEKGAVEKMAFKGKVRNQRDTGKKSKSAGETGLLKPGRRSFGPKNGPMCLIECVLRNESLLDAQNEVNIQALTERFVKSAGDSWKTLVETQVKTCWDELNKVDFSSMPQPPAGAVTCKPKAAMLMSCVRRGLIMNCPASSTKSEDQSCPKKLEKLKQCDPFSIPPPRSARRAAKKGAAGGKPSAKAAAKPKGNKKVANTN